MAEERIASHCPRAPSEAPVRMKGRKCAATPGASERAREGGKKRVRAAWQHREQPAELSSSLSSVPLSLRVARVCQSVALARASPRCSAVHTGAGTVTFVPAAASARSALGFPGLLAKLSAKGLSYLGMAGGNGDVAAALRGLLFVFLGSDSFQAEISRACGSLTRGRGWRRRGRWAEGGGRWAEGHGLRSAD